VLACRGLAKFILLLLLGVELAAGDVTNAAEEI